MQVCEIVWQYHVSLNYRIIQPAMLICRCFLITFVQSPAGVFKAKPTSHLNKITTPKLYELILFVHVFNSVRTDLEINWYER